MKFAIGLEKVEASFVIAKMKSVIIKWQSTPRISYSDSTLEETVRA
jgi:hypothetical protein